MSFPPHLSSELELLFPVPLIRYRIPDCADLNSRLEECIHEKMRSSETSAATNRGDSWRSNKSFLKWDNAAVQELKGHMDKALGDMIKSTVSEPKSQHFEDWIFESWALVHRSGGYNVAHIHSSGRFTWSGIYYLKTGFPEGVPATKGITVLQDRSAVPKEVINNPDPFEREYKIAPEPGLLVMFPSTVWHYVEPFEGDEERITIPFNCSNPNFVTPFYKNMSDYLEVTKDNWAWRNLRGLMMLLDKNYLKSRIKEKMGRK
ncbi:MAG: TIGR02466 family protein [Verrucomicrobia bacterium]|nr:TIGR02466 family protein [Verrucomicrobiota bacterium]MDA1069575.1 TIGR02466 family protein [Verrucomicrobiota bacterium]